MGERGEEMRRMSKDGCVIVIAVAGVGLLLQALYEGAAVLALLGAGIAVVSYLAVSRAVRRRRLLEKYEDIEVVNRIMSRLFWQGQTAEQLTDSLGKPAAVDHIHRRTVHREVWKYSKSGYGRYRLRITLDDDVVTGWEQKGVAQGLRLAGRIYRHNSPTIFDSTPPPPPNA